MKRSLKIFLILLSLVIISLENVFASEKDYQAVEAGLAGKTALLVCSYEKDANDPTVKIYYYLENNDNSKANKTPWEVFLHAKNELSLTGKVEWLLKGDGTFQWVFVSSNGNVHYDSDGGHMKKSDEASFKCPSKAYYEVFGIKEVCFTDNEDCGEKFKLGPYNLKNDSASIFSIIDKYMSLAVTDDKNIEILRTNASALSSSIRSATTDYIKKTYSMGNGNTYKLPAFIENYINSTEIAETSLNALKNKVFSAIDKDVNEGKITKEKGEKEKSRIMNISTTINSSNPTTGSNLNLRNDTDCDGLLGPEMTQIVHNIFKFIQYLGPILVAVLSIKDFVTAVLSGDAGDMKKASNKLVKRVIVAILLFFIPLIAGILFDIANVTVPENCIGK